MGIPGAEVARLLLVTTSVVSRRAVAAELADVKKYLNAL